MNKKVRGLTLKVVDLHACFVKYLHHLMVILGFMFIIRQAWDSLGHKTYIICHIVSP